ncbi:hypothetical protein [Roseateles violae]|uniref:YqjK-like protein n=1 Tax=Roseateles violae TaxID=3058042 RepID=A0ABT8DWP6_9BURK|nr:hypothetical protein [Pelomonas sp. PFR6]MDN3922581.1 hypothetical protein [Pelomonas sp. PFR6]
MGGLARRQAELQQRQLALRLRNLELRAGLRSDLRRLARPLGWFGAAGAGAGIAVLLAGARRPGSLLRALGIARLGLRIARLLRSLRA